MPGPLRAEGGEEGLDERNGPEDVRLELGLDIIGAVCAGEPI